MKCVTILFIFLLTSSCKLSSIGEAPSLSLSKDLCSCYFVANQSEKYCRQITKYQRIFARYSVDWDNKTVTARGFCVKSTSVFQNERLGCTIAKSKNMACLSHNELANL